MTCAVDDMALKCVEIAYLELEILRSWTREAHIV